MEPIKPSEILGLSEYEQIREPFRRRIIELKRQRRVALGSNMSVLFENRDTVLFQIQEMLRTERITRESGILHEIETYNSLIPGARQLSATIFIEYPDAAERDRMLVALAGIEQLFYLNVAGTKHICLGENRGERTDRTTAVQYVRFPLSESSIEHIKTRLEGVSVGVGHPHYSASSDLPEELIRSLREDLDS